MLSLILFVFITLVLLFQLNGLFEKRRNKWTDWAMLAVSALCFVVLAIDLGAFII